VLCSKSLINGFKLQQDYNDKDHKKTFSILTKFFLNNELVNVEKLKELNAVEDKHKKTLEVLREILTSNYTTDGGIQKPLDFDNIIQDDILYFLGNFLASAGKAEINKPQTENFYKHLKILGMFLTSEKLEDVYTKEIPIPVYIDKQDKLKIFGEFLIKGRSTEFRELQILDDKNYQNRLNFLGNFILSENPENFN
jgi:hypothetical protein